MNKAPPSTPSSRPALETTLRVLLVLAAVVLLLNLLRYRECVVDDTYISLRYANNLVQGHGLVFNPGERVEGYTNPSFVLLAAVFLALGLDPVTWLRGVLLLSMLATLWGVIRLERLALPAYDRRCLPISPVLLAPLQAFAFWAICPMEAMLFTALLVWGVLLVIEESRSRRLRGSVLVFALLVLTRPDGGLVFATAVAAVAGHELFDGGLASSWRRHLANAAALTIVLAPHLLWRRWYYGAWVPNTFTAKTTWGWSQLSTGLTASYDWARAHPLLLLALATPFLLRLMPSRRPRPADGPVVVVWAVAVAWVAYVSIIGGDFMPFFRFFVPVLPLSCVLLAWLARPALWGGERRWPALVMAAAVVMHVALSMITEQAYRALVAHRTAVVGEEVGRWCHQELAEGDLIAVNTAGTLPYRAGLPTIDMLGLTEAEIARRPVFVVSQGWASHRRGWGRHVLSRRPRLILWYNSAGARGPHYLSDRELADHPVFRFFYLFRATTLPAIGEDGGPATPFSWVPGLPFGDGNGEGRSLSMVDLGLSATPHRRPLPWTALRERQIRLRYFLFDPRDRALWPEGGVLEAGVPALVDRATELWRAEVPSRRGHSENSESRARVERICAEVQRLVEAGETEEAKRLLQTAVQLNREVGLSLVPQYVANVATVTGDLWTAVAAQKEALRLSPRSRIYRDNLISLLTVRYDDFVEIAGSEQ